MSAEDYRRGKRLLGEGHVLEAIDPADTLDFVSAAIRQAAVESASTLTLAEFTDTRDLLRFGLAEPYATLVLVAGGEAGPARALRIGAAAPDGGRYAMTQAEELVFVLDGVTVTRLLEALEKPAP